MKRAVELAGEAAARGEIPVGAVIVKNGKIVGEGSNRREEKQSSLSHAEIEAIADACRRLGSWRLDDCSVYTTLEPCVMCSGAILSSRISEVVFGAYDPQCGCADSAINLFSLLPGNKVTVYGGICEDECKELIDGFFRTVRNK